MLRYGYEAPAFSLPSTSGREAPLAEDRRSLVDVAIGLGQRALAVHEPRAGSFAQLLHELRRDVRHACSYSCLAAA